MEFPAGLLLMIFLVTPTLAEAKVKQLYEVVGGVPVVVVSGPIYSIEVLVLKATHALVEPLR
jgi:hypothetical protein